MLGLIIFFSLVGGVFSLVGGVMLLMKGNWSKQTSLLLISFAAGVLLSVSFTDLLPEAMELAEGLAIEPSVPLFWSLLGIVMFFLFERWFFWWHHHHHDPHKGHPDPVVAMVVAGDTIHNFVDGIVIAASFLVSQPLGMVTAVAVAAHEIPQEIADFSLFLSKGMSKSRVLLINIASSLATLAGALGTYFLGSLLLPVQPHLLGFTAGMFTYIAGADLIPELHSEYKPKTVRLQTVAFLGGIVITLLLKMWLE